MFKLPKFEPNYLKKKIDHVNASQEKTTDKLSHKIASNTHHHEQESHMIKDTQPFIYLFYNIKKSSIHLYFETSVVYKMFIINHQFIKNLFIHVQIDIKKTLHMYMQNNY